MKKSIWGIIAGIVLIICVLGYCGRYGNEKEKASYEKQNEATEEVKQTYYYKAQGESLYLVNGQEETEIFIKGVNMGLGKPCAFPGEIAITKDEYSRWFEWIGEMNANTIRVYTVQGPEFYEALYDYNKSHDEPIYLLHGVWYDEQVMEETFDVLDEKNVKTVYKDIKNLINIFHGNASVKEETGYAGGDYRWDISEYVMGWILGIETDAYMVEATNENHPDSTSYDGKYFSTTDASAVEVFWAMMADYATTYEMEKYGMQRPISFSNWLTTDILEHPDEPYEDEDKYELNEQKLNAKEGFEAGVFATYHIYPYYPDFLYCEEEYTSYKDEDGEINTYRAYLEDLKAAYDIPVLVGEFGVPASRGVSHANPYSNYNQGNMEEAAQAEAICSMYDDIVAADYAGAIVFSWQDEWFKRTWNTMDYNNSNRRAYWNDMQTSEQHYGILEFIPTKPGLQQVIDGDGKEWTDNNEIASSDALKLSARTDAAYLYLMVESEEYNFDEDEIIIPLDITPNSGSTKYEEYELEMEADFVIHINGKENSRVLVQSYYDLYSFDYVWDDEDIRADEEALSKNSTLFNPIYHMIERTLYLPSSERVIPLVKHETGKLVYGTTDEESEDYYSLADFCYENGVLELRIPWALIGFRDPSQKEIQHDFREAGEHGGTNIEGITLGVYGVGEAIGQIEYTWNNWDVTTYTERKRQVYYGLQERFGETE